MRTLRRWLRMGWDYASDWEYHRPTNTWMQPETLTVTVDEAMPWELRP